eukprot:Sspe_Gene.11325::Locus_3824_Transcript_1_1_Confidence_1.000_Length_2670::g.11325::m.11325
MPFHNLEVHYTKDEAEMEDLLKKYIVDPGLELVGLAFKMKMVKSTSGERSRHVAMVQFCTDEVALVLHLASMGSLSGWRPNPEGNFADVMKNPKLKKVGLNVLPMVGMLKKANDVECKGVYDLIPMAQRVKTAASFKGYTKYNFPDMSREGQAVANIRTLAKMAIGKEETPPSGFNHYPWDSELTPEMLDWVSYEPVIARKVYDFLSDVEEELAQAKGPAALYATNLPGDVNAEELHKFFKCTSSKEPKIQTAPKSRSTANAALFYNEKEEAEEALEKFTGCTFKGREIIIALEEDKLKQAEQKMQADRQGRQVYISNLPFFTTENRIRNHFKALADDIIEAKFYCFQDFGVGSIYFKTEDAATKAVDMYNGEYLSYPIKKMEPDGTIQIKHNHRMLFVDKNFNSVIQRQKQSDRKKEKDEYDALDPFYFNLHRTRKHDDDQGPHQEHEEHIVEKEHKPKMKREEKVVTKTKMRVDNRLHMSSDQGLDLKQLHEQLTHSKPAMEPVGQKAAMHVVDKTPVHEQKVLGGIGDLARMVGVTAPSTQPPPKSPPRKAEPPKQQPKAQPASVPAAAPTAVPSAPKQATPPAQPAAAPSSSPQMPRMPSVPVTSMQQPIGGLPFPFPGMMSQYTVLLELMKRNKMMDPAVMQQALMQQQMAAQAQQAQQTQQPQGLPGVISIGGQPIAGYYSGQPMMQNQMSSPPAPATAVSAPPGNTHTNTIHIIGIPYPCDEKELRKHCQQAGPVVSVVISQSKGANNQNRGHATVAYATPQYAYLAVKQLHLSVFQGKQITVDLYRAKTQRSNFIPPEGEREKIKVEKPEETKVRIEKPSDWKKPETKEEEEEQKKEKVEA